MLCSAAGWRPGRVCNISARPNRPWQTSEFLIPGQQHCLSPLHRLHQYSGASHKGVHRIRASALRRHFLVASRCGADVAVPRPARLGLQDQAYNLRRPRTGGCGGLPGEVILTCCPGKDRFAVTQRFYNSLYEPRTSPRACLSFTSGGVRQQEYSRWSGAQRTTGLFGWKR
ncbi:hypothetical protein NDU88_002447 [Pleurodeles waltl]|uniref:Uncharacterized protein n=1 Tax=Pleurodeles waltl TaxID=8319 RepID=A0AAV7TL95_PLEWA|nr:hypothetical protein NDU88_002447 [Pleurodeles waltl]